MRKKDIINLKKQSKNINDFLLAFTEPFEYLNKTNEYSYKNICMTTFNKNMKADVIDTTNILFPRDIISVYWYREGENDEESWEFIGKIKYKNNFRYVYYSAWCDYTGFDCMGGMKLYFSKSMKKLFDLCISHDIVQLIKNEK
jgi:hypothetical protein